MRSIKSANRDGHLVGLPPAKPRRDVEQLLRQTDARDDGHARHEAEVVRDAVSDPGKEDVEIRKVRVALSERPSRRSKKQSGIVRIEPLKHPVNDAPADRPNRDDGRPGHSDLRPADGEKNHRRLILFNDRSPQRGTVSQHDRDQRIAGQRFLSAKAAGKKRREPDK
ncbi:MAG: hypothetical protein IH876_01290 [Gemmatimonadetes bacterium]|nr:hypothetical protein [Gemmatimonadota bacterium]